VPPGCCSWTTKRTTSRSFGSPVSGRTCYSASIRATGQKSKPRRFTAYEVAESDPAKLFRLAPENALFVLSEKGFYAPADWTLTLIRDPASWYNATMTALWAALEPLLAAV
jgi:hypothetical protein